MAPIPYFELIKIPVQFCKAMGQDILESAIHNRLKTNSLKILLYAGLVNFLVNYILQMVFFILLLKSAEYELAFAMAPVVGFGIVPYVKIIALHLNKPSVRNILKEFEGIYPKTLQLQKDYQLEQFLRFLKPIMKFYAVLCVMNTIYYSLFPIIKSTLYAVVFEDKFDYPLPLFIWYPFDPRQNWILYIFSYVTQFHATLLTAIGYLTTDLFLVSTVEQLCMHFTYISSMLEQFQPDSDDNNRRFLRRIVRHHIKCLELSNSVDNVFGYSLLLNFLASAGTLCFVGFEVTSATTEALLRNIVLLVTTLSQVFVICFYGNKLISTSQAVGEAAFGHAWYMCNVEYRRMVVLIIARSQKIAAIHAPTFPSISLETFMKVVSMSYQFFAVIRTTSDNN